MKTGRNLTELAQEIERQTTTRKDYLAPTTQIAMEVDENLRAADPNAEALDIIGLNGSPVGITPYAHGHLSGETGIPKVYYDRMRTAAPTLLAANVNHWLHAEPKTRLVRTLDGRMRAFLSDRYRPLDNFDLAQVALPEILTRGARVESSQLTETRLYIKAVLPDLEAEVQGSRQKGDIVQAGLVISNSEVGAGAVRIEPMLYRLICLNGAIMPDSGMKRYHVGKQADPDAQVREMLSTEARTADDRAFWLKVRDVVRGAFDRDIFTRLVERAEAAAGMRIFSPHLDKVVEVTARTLSLGDGKDTMDGLLQALIEGGDLTQWGLANAITAQSQGIDSYDTATDWERAGGRVLELEPQDWKRITTAGV